MVCARSKFFFLCTRATGLLVAGIAFFPTPNAYAELSAMERVCQREGLQAILDHFEILRLAGHNIPVPHIGRRPALLATHLDRNRVTDWFMISIEMPAGSIDPLYAEIAKAKGEDLIMGGVDVATATFGLPKRLRAMGSEINDLAEAGAQNSPNFVERFVKQFDVVAPAWGTRTAPISVRLDVNLEAGGSLDAIVKAGVVDSPLSYKFPMHPAAFRGSAVIHVPTNGGPAQMIFRTPVDYRRYLTKTLHVPEAEFMKPATYLRHASPEEMKYIFGYNLRIATLGRSRGWKFDQESVAFLAALRKKLSPEYLSEALERVRTDIVEQGQAHLVPDIEKVLSDLGT